MLEYMESDPNILFLSNTDGLILPSFSFAIVQRIPFFRHHLRGVRHHHECDLAAFKGTGSGGHRGFRRRGDRSDPVPFGFAQFPEDRPDEGR